MSTYTIVSKDKDPLEPGEVHAGETITVSDDDIFVVDPSADGNITFVSDGTGPTDFDIVIDESNAGDFVIKVESNLTAYVDIADDVNLSDIDFTANTSDGVALTAGHNVSFGQFNGSVTGPNDVTIGNGFSTNKNWKLGDVDDTLSVGDDAVFANIDTGRGDDTVVFGDRATMHDLNTDDGNDDVTFGDDMVAHDVKTGKDDDKIRTGENAQASSFDGGEGDDGHNSRTTDTNSKNMESSSVVCFAEGMTLETIDGPVHVEDLREGMLIETVDHGFQPVRWTGSIHLDEPMLTRAPHLRPIRIGMDALGPGTPKTDLVLSPQHRVIARSPVVERMYGTPEVFVPAKLLTVLPGVSVENTARSITYHHVLLPRHEVVLSHGVDTESLYLGVETLKSLKHRITAMLPDPQGDTADLARRAPQNKTRLRHMLQRHLQNSKPVQQGRAQIRSKLAG